MREVIHVTTSGRTASAKAPDYHHAPQLPRSLSRNVRKVAKRSVKEGLRGQDTRGIIARCTGQAGPNMTFHRDVVTRITSSNVEIQGRRAAQKTISNPSSSRSLSRGCDTQDEEVRLLAISHSRAERVRSMRAWSTSRVVL
jgi:hypothetical protein